MFQMHGYNGYTLTVRGNHDEPKVSVFDPRFPTEAPVFQTTSLDEAMRWVDAYRDGQAWTVTL